MLRFLVRALGLILLACAFAAAIIDGTRSIAGAELITIRFGDLCFYAFPKFFPLLQPAVERNIHPLLWDPVLKGLFLAPAWLVLSVLGLLLIWVARRRPAAIGFSSRP